MDLRDAPPETPLRLERRARFEEIQHLLSPEQQRVLSLAYVYGRWGRWQHSRGPVRLNATLKRALNRLSDVGIKLEMPVPVWDVPEGTVWEDDDTTVGAPCPVCGFLMRILLPDGPGRADRSMAWCAEFGRSRSQQDAHEAHERAKTERERKN